MLGCNPLFHDNNDDIDVTSEWCLVDGYMTNYPLVIIQTKHGKIHTFFENTNYLYGHVQELC